MHYQQHGDLIAVLSRIADALEDIGDILAGIEDALHAKDKKCKCGHS